jgi:hypothetical protein
MKLIENEVFTGERSLFFAEELDLRGCTFRDGESPLKESHRIRLDGCRFEWKYPIWYSDGVTVRRTTLSKTARSGIWYTKNITMSGCLIEAPKTFRRSENILLHSVSMPNAEETMWNCRDVNLFDVSVTGDYFGMGSVGVTADGLDVVGNYIFDGGINIVVKNSRLISKDAFWNCENVLVTDSYIEGEYLGWNSSHVRFVNCTIESNQGLCYMKNVTLENCILKNTDLAFEYSTVNADIRSGVISIKNPTSGKITVDSVGEIIIDGHAVSPDEVEIVVREGKDV